MSGLKVLIACEFSGTVREAFAKRGHDAWSCDLEASELPGNHYQGDMFDIVNDGWDLIIAHPPCTHLAVSGAAHFAKKRADGRQQQGIDFFMRVMNIDVPKLAVENPIGIMSTLYRKPDQIIQPWEYGDKAQKSTCLWLKGLPLLKPTNIVEKGEFFEWQDKKTGKMKRQPKWFYDALSKSPKEREKIRNKTFQGIANAMAEQWG
jgi:site-specific DNA-cytosine methylase